MEVKNIYIAGTFSSDEDRKSLKGLINLVRHKYPDADVFVPMEHKVEGDFQRPDGSWFLPNEVWARRVFNMDLAAIDRADIVFAMYTGHKSTTGTSWEMGYAYASGKPIIGYIPFWAEENNMSLMIINSLSGYVNKEGNIVWNIDEEFRKKYNQK